MVDAHHPLNIEPLWTNHNIGQNVISKKLSMVFIKEELIMRVFTYRASTLKEALSNHNHILLELSIGEKKPPSSFKFNSH